MHLYYIARRLTRKSDIRRVGLKLGVADYRIDAIFHDKRDDITEAAYETLKEWRKGQKDNRTTFITLGNVLTHPDVNLGQVAWEVLMADWFRSWSKTNGYKNPPICREKKSEIRKLGLRLHVDDHKINEILEKSEDWLILRDILHEWMQKQRNMETAITNLCDALTDPKGCLSELGKDFFQFKGTIDKEKARENWIDDILQEMVCFPLFRETFTCKRFSSNKLDFDRRPHECKQSCILF